jgi:hypothetical protein
MPTPHPRPKDRRSGFALLITITLLAFLVLLLVSLAALTRVETQVASNSQQLSQARQNALMALNVAIGKLQAAAGPDQRITATAEFDSTADPTNRHWTGVWDSDPGSPTYGQRLSWLVSGTAPDVAVAVPDPALSPTASVRLVGENSADLSTPAASAQNRVDVTVENIRANTVPGLADIPGGHVVGRFGYWVGDEGVKAKVSLADPWATATLPEEKAYQLRGAQRAGIELVDSIDGTPLSSSYLANDINLPKVLSLEQFSLSNSANETVLRAAAKNRYHDLTASSYSVLADVAQGGLKKDLTTWIGQPANNLPAGSPQIDDPIFPRPAGDTSSISPARWGIIHSYAQLKGGTTAITPRPQTDRQQGFHPVLTYCRLGFSAHAGSPNTSGLSELVAQVFPLVVLWNPYDTPIAAEDYEFGLGFHNQSGGGPAVRFGIGNSGTGTFKGALSLSGNPRLMSTSTDPTATGLSTSAAHLRFMRFVVSSPIIPPGESLVFTLADSGPYILPSAIVAPGGNTPIPLVPNALPAMDNSVFFSNSAITLTATERNLPIRITVGTPWVQFGLFQRQASGSDPTVADLLTQDPYCFMGTIRAGPGTSNAVISPPYMNPQVELKNHMWGRVQMSKYSTNGSFYPNFRWLAQLNPRAPYHLRVPPGHGMASSLTMLFENVNSTNQPGSERFDGNKASAGPWVLASNSTSQPTVNLQIAGLAPDSPHSGGRFFSLAQLQHANFSLLGQAASHPVGNSEVNPVVGRTLTELASVPDRFDGPPASNRQWYYDTSYLLNRALWDRYYFSTLPNDPAQILNPGDLTDPTFHLPNARHAFYRRDNLPATPASLIAPTAFDTASAALLVNGGFNVNSTSEQAWRAILASHNRVDTTTTDAFTHAYARFSTTLVGSDANMTWSDGQTRRTASSYRKLSDAQINLLAKKVVAEVKARGPFLSLADFVNRRLLADATGIKGTLQAAIDATDLDTVAAARINDRAPFNDYSAYRISSSALTGLERVSVLANNDADFNRPSSSRAAHAPGYLTQADLLNALGPVLTARSDTFIVRAYGDVQNPVTNTTEGKAVCEAVVQRVPDYVDPTIDPWTTPVANSDSEKFGRRFKIVSFRWLSEKDI